MNLNEIFELIASNLSGIIHDLDKEAIMHESKLNLLGANSVDRAELIEKTLEDLKLQVDRFEFHSASNLGELAKMFFERMKVKSL